MFLRTIIVISCVLPTVGEPCKDHVEKTCCKTTTVCVTRCVKKRERKVLQKVKQRVQCRKACRCCDVACKAEEPKKAVKPCDDCKKTTAAKSVIEQIPYEIKESASIQSAEDLIIVPLEQNVKISAGQEVSAAVQPAAALRGPLALVSEAAVRITVGNVCGSGTVVGRNDQGKSIILTNAHVAGTKRGREVKVQRWGMNGTSERGTAKIIAAGYKRGASLDYALLECNGDFAADVTPIPLAQRYPDTTNSITSTGCPRCEWPSMQVLKLINDQGQVLSWKPEAISGRSGSSVIEHTQEGPRVVGLLTWAGNGNGLGQSTLLVLDALYGTLPRSLESLPEGVQEIAFIQEEDNKELVEDIVVQETSSAEETDEEVAQRKGLFRNRDNSDDGDSYPGPIRRGLDFIRRVIITAVLCLVAFAAGYLFGRMK